MSERSYPYAVSRIKASEYTLLDRAEWNRLWEADAAEGLRLLHDMGYGSSAKDQNDIDALTQAQVSQARALVNEITPDRTLTDLFQLPVDGHNIKAMLKGLIEREDVTDILLPGGTIALETLKDAFEADSYTHFPIKLREAVDAFDPSLPPGIISARIDNAVYAQTLYALRPKRRFDFPVDADTNTQIVRRYFQAKIDFTNILSVLRAFHLGWGREKIAPYLISGGELSENALIAALESGKDHLAEALGKGYYGTKIRDVVNTYLQDGNIVRAENRFERLCFGIIHDDYTNSFGIGPILNYLLQKEFEARTLRVLFAAKRAGRTIELSDLGVA